MNQAKSSHLYIDEDIRNKRNPFKNNNWVDLYKEETEQEERIGKDSNGRNKINSIGENRYGWNINVYRNKQE